MAYGIDISGLENDFSRYAHSFDLIAEQNRIRAERRAQSEQALLTLALAGGGAALGGLGLLGGAGALTGAQGGAAAASLLGPRPNIGAAVSLGAGAAQTYGADQAAATRNDALNKFQAAVNPAPIVDETGRTTTPPVNFGQAADAATRLGDIGTAAKLILASRPGTSGKTPDLYEVGLPNGEVRSGLTYPDMQQALRDNPGSRAAKMPTGLPAEGAAGTPKAPTTRTFQKMVDGEPVKITQEWQVDPQTNKGGWQEVGRVPIAKSGEGGARTSTNAVDLVDLQIKAGQVVARESGRTDVINAMERSGAGPQALMEVGKLDQRQVQSEYVKLLKAEIAGGKPKEEKAIAQAELDRVQGEITQRETLAKQARDALGKATTNEQRKAIIADAQGRGLDLQDLGLSGLTLAR